MQIFVRHRHGSKARNQARVTNVWLTGLDNAPQCFIDCQSKMRHRIEPSFFFAELVFSSRLPSATRNCAPSLGCTTQIHPYSTIPRVRRQAFCRIFAKESRNPQSHFRVPRASPTNPKNIPKSTSVLTPSAIPVYSGVDARGGIDHVRATECNRLQHEKKVSAAARRVWHGSLCLRGAKCA